MSAREVFIWSMVYDISPTQYEFALRDGVRIGAKAVERRRCEIHPTRGYTSPLSMKFWPDTVTNPVELGLVAVVVVAGALVVVETVVVVEATVVVAVPGTHWE